MIISIKHKALRHFAESGDARGLTHVHLERLAVILSILNEMEGLEELYRLYKWKLHPLTGNLNGYWAVKVNKNWRLVFQYDEEENNVSNIDLIDYH